MANATLVLLAKTMTILVTIRAGGWGGTLTSGLAFGAGPGAATGLLWDQIWPGTSIAAFVFISAAVFLRASTKTPLTELVPLMEFTHQGGEIFVPAILTIGGAVAATARAERTHTEAE